VLILILRHDKLSMGRFITQFFAQKKDSGFALPAALLLVFLCTTLLATVLSRSKTADLEKYLRLNKIDASNLSRAGLESAVTQIRTYSAGPSQFPTNTWVTLTTNDNGTNDTRICGIASQFSSSAVVRMSPNRYLYKNYAMRHFAINEVDGATGDPAFPSQWRIVSCVISLSKPYFAKTRSALVRFAIQDNGASLTSGTIIDVRDY
jgi:hypothetical protein